MNKKISTTLAFSVIIILAILVAGISFYLWKGIKTENSSLTNLPRKNKMVACTEEAKLCPDGSAVGRTAPNCEFAPCPEIVGIANKIIITSLKPNDEIASPVLILGSAVGGWFFEGDFPSEVYDDNGKKLGSHFCSFISKSEEDTWMTEDFVDFRCEINFSEPKTEKGYLLFKKDNPSDMRELDEEFKLPVKFSSNYNISQLKNGCDFLKNFENQKWFAEMIINYKDELPKGDNGNFYFDFSELGRKQGCLYSNYFIFTPSEFPDASGQLFLYNILNKKLIEAPNDEKYFTDDLMDINGSYVSFTGGGGSGECFYENYGKYYYQTNKVVIYRECGFCNKSSPETGDCGTGDITYK